MILYDTPDVSCKCGITCPEVNSPHRSTPLSHRCLRLLNFENKILKCWWCALSTKKINHLPKITAANTSLWQRSYCSSRSKILFMALSVYFVLVRETSLVTSGSIRDMAMCYWWCESCTAGGAPIFPADLWAWDTAVVSIRAFFLAAIIFQ